MTRVYLDHSATSPLRPQAFDAMRRAMECDLARGGNPSSVHREGRAARALVEGARLDVAALAGAEPAETIFTSGATEANALALHSAIRAQGVRRLLLGASEHPSMVANAQALGESFDVEVGEIALTETGEVDFDDLEAQLSNGPKAAVALMAVNNETGVAHPMAQISERVRAAEGLLIVDAVQRAPMGPFSLEALHADYLTLSAHKIGGPAGIGALIAAEDKDPAALLMGGGQEFRRRAGTENVLGMVGFAAAAQAVCDASNGEASRLAALRQRLEDALKAEVPGIVVVGRDATVRAPHISCLALAGARAEMLVMALDLEGIAISAGSACSSGKVARSPVLTAMGLQDELASSAIRVSLGWTTCEADVDRFVRAYCRAVSGAVRSSETSKTSMRTNVQGKTPSETEGETAPGLPASSRSKV